MVNVLIPTKPDDTHAIFTKLALEKKGHRSLLWYTADFPSQQRHSFELSNGKINWSSVGIDFEVMHNDEFDVVWVRRARRPVLPSYLHPDDIENAKNENAELFKTFWHIISPHAFWVNPANSIHGANNKLRQLKAAVKVGFNVPETLMSNDSQKIRLFIQKYKKNGVIYKTLFPVAWFEEKEMRLTYTKEINVEDLPDDKILQSVPGIFQKKINKSFELRVTYFGDYGVSAKLKSQEHIKGKMDWRYIPTQELVVEEFELPQVIHEKCKALMRELNIVFGCFDFIVTPDNEYYFLEVNEQGQFLWVEEVNPDIKMLDPFAEFLASSSREFHWKKTANSVSLDDFRVEMSGIKKAAMALHVNPETFF